MSLSSRTSWPARVSPPSPSLSTSTGAPSTWPGRPTRSVPPPRFECLVTRKTFMLTSTSRGVTSASLPSPPRPCPYLRGMWAGPSSPRRPCLGTSAVTAQLSSQFGLKGPWMQPSIRNPSSPERSSPSWTRYKAPATTSGHRTGLLPHGQVLAQLLGEDAGVQGIRSGRRESGQATLTI